MKKCETGFRNQKLYFITPKMEIGTILWNYKGNKIVDERLEFEQCCLLPEYYGQEHKQDGWSYGNILLLYSD